MKPIKDWTLHQKIVFHPRVFTLIAVIGSWYFVSSQIEETESWYREELRTLAAASAYMDHRTADEFMQTKGRQFHRLVSRYNYSAAGKTEIERKAEAAFRQDSKLIQFAEKITVGDSVFLAVFTHAKIRPECTACHSDSSGNCTS